MPKLDARLSLDDLTAPRSIAVAFVLYGLVAIAFLAVNMPPFQNPDEPAHLLRAEQVADGGLIGTRFQITAPDGSSHVTAGGLADPALLAALSPFQGLISHQDARAAQSYWAPRVKWSGARALESFPNTAIYPPLFYVPSAIGVLVGRMTRMTVVQTLMVSRMLTGIAAVAVGAAAIACAGGAAVWVFAVLTLPMALSMMASSSIDALLLACSALAGALLFRMLHSPDVRNGRVLAVLAGTLVLLATARPPYVALAALPLALTEVPFRYRILAGAAIVAGVTIWSAIAAAAALTNTGVIVGADPAAQMAMILHAPLLLARAVCEAFLQNRHLYLVGFIGELGWLDTELPQRYHHAALAILMLAAMATMLGTNGTRIDFGSRLMIAVGSLVSAMLVFAIQYLTWTVPGRLMVEGVQGRYFLPLALTGGAALFPMPGIKRLAPIRNALAVTVLTFPVVSLAVVMRAVVLRYYLQ